MNYYFVKKADLLKNTHDYRVKDIEQEQDMNKQIFIPLNEKFLQKL